MAIRKEKRAFERIELDSLRGSVELKETIKTVSIINGCEEGVCVNSADFPVGSVVRLVIGSREDQPGISLYCKVVWVSTKKGLVWESDLRADITTSYLSMRPTERRASATMTAKTARGEHMPE